MKQELLPQQKWRLLRRWAACLLAAALTWFFLTVGPAMTAYAASETIEITLSEDYETCVFQIQWENRDAAATVEVHSPSGTVFSESATPDQVSAGQGNVIVNVGAAHNGETWQVIVTGDGLGKVTVDGGALPGSMNIDSFTVTAVNEEEGTYKAAWSVSDCPEDLSFEIYADTSSSAFNGERVASFNGGPTGEQEFDIGGLETGDYFFYLRVSAAEGMFNRAYAQGSFSYANPSAADALQNVQARMLNEEVLLTWEMGDHTEFKVFFWDKATGDLVFDKQVSNDNGYEWQLPEGQGDLLAAVAAYDNEQVGRYERLEVAVTNPVQAQVTFPEGDAVNTSTIVVQVSFDGDYKVSASLNEELVLEDETHQGDYRVDLSQGDNDIIFLIEDAQGNMRSFQKQLYVDTTPPQLSVHQDINGAQTGDDYIYLSGYTEQGVTLLLNGQEAAMENGYFNIRCQLNLGGNQLTLTARDVAGNESVYQAAVTRTTAGGSLWQWIVGGAVFLVLLALYAVLYIRRVRQMRREKRQAQDGTPSPTGEDPNGGKEKKGRKGRKK